MLRFTLRVASIELVTRFNSETQGVSECERVGLTLAPEDKSFPDVRLDILVPAGAPNPFRMQQRVQIDVDEHDARDSALPLVPPFLFAPRFPPSLAALARRDIGDQPPTAAMAVPIGAGIAREHRPDELEALDNMNASDWEWCADVHDGLQCTRKRNHDGDHVSGFALDARNDAADTRWPNIARRFSRPADEEEAIEGAEDLSLGWCNDATPGLNCTRRPGHGGDHVSGFAVTSGYAKGVRWPASLPPSAPVPHDDELARFEHEGGPALINRDLGDETADTSGRSATCLTGAGVAPADINDDIKF